MRKHSPRKWLHAVLDLLPVILIPVFMIYSHRHTMTQQTTVDVQYKYQSNEVNSLNDLVSGNIYYYDELTFNAQLIHTYDVSYDFDILSCESFTIDNVDYYSDEVYIDNYNSNNDNYISISIQVNQFDFAFNAYFSNGYGYVSYVLDEFDTCTFNKIVFRYISFDEYSMQDLNLSLPQYTDYNVIESVQVNDETSSVTDVFVDNFTNTVNTKFNFAQMFNFNDIWSWLNTNLFNNISSPLAYAIYNIIIYEFLMDILFIIYALFMFIIDFCECLLEKPFDKVKRG